MLLARDPGKLGLGAQSQLHMLANLLSYLLGLRRAGAGDLGSDDNVRLALDERNVALVDGSRGQDLGHLPQRDPVERNRGADLQSRDGLVEVRFEGEVRLE